MNDERVKALLQSVAEQTDPAQLRHQLFAEKRLSAALEQASDPDHAVKVSEIVFKRLADCDKQIELSRGSFDEFKDRDFANWRRARGAIEHENILVVHRLTWLTTTQGFLFASFGLLLQNAASSQIPDDRRAVFRLMASVIPLVGILLAAILWRMIRAAERQHEHLRAWWNAVRGRGGENWTHPDVAGNHQTALDRWACASTLPVIIGLTWGAMFPLMHSGWLADNASVVFHGLLAVATVMALAFGVYMVYLAGQRSERRRHHRSNSNPHKTDPARPPTLA